MKRMLFWLIILAVLGCALAVYTYKNLQHSPVPKAVRSAVHFPIYYPDQTKLPPGYRLDIASIANPVQNGVAYSVIYDGSKKLIFSLQPKPSDNELQSFNTSYIPLNIEYQTAIGSAKIGAYNNHGKLESLISLPTDTNTWIIVTAPYDINQNQLKQVLSSLKK